MGRWWWFPTAPALLRKLKARIMATGQAGSFGESGQRFSSTVEDTPQNSRELLARVDFAPGTDADMESMLGFRQDLGYAGSVQSVAAISIHPDSGGAPAARGSRKFRMSSQETMHFGDMADVEVGSARRAGPHIGRDARAGAALCFRGMAPWQLDGSLSPGDDGAGS